MPDSIEGDYPAPALLLDKIDMLEEKVAKLEDELETRADRITGFEDELEKSVGFEFLRELMAVARRGDCAEIEEQLGRIVGW